MAQNITWLGFCSSGTLTRTAVHFFPSAGGVTAPYSAQCKLTLFGGGTAFRTVVLDGARLSQPDGVWLDDAFQELRNSNGYMGILIELVTTQPRVDLSASGCVLEFHSGLNLSRYSPQLLNTNENQRGALPLIKDGYANSSLIIANLNDTEAQPNFVTTMQTRDATCNSAKLSVPPISAKTVTEINLPENFYYDTPPQECSWGLLRLAAVSAETPLPPGVATYLTYRDATNGQLLSVCAL